MRDINLIIVHCSATIEGKNFHASNIGSWHKERGFDCIGYHYVIDLDGTIEKGRPVEEIGAHTSGFNKSSIGVCYIGGLAADGKTPKDTRTDAQKEALLKLLSKLKSNYPRASVHGHREFAKKYCPCFDAYTEYKNL